MCRKHYAAKTITVEVGALGSLPPNALAPFRQLLHTPPAKQWNDFLYDLSLLALQRSSFIFGKRSG